MRLLPTKWKKTLKKYGVQWGVGAALTLAAVLNLMGYLESESIVRMDTFFAGWRMRVEKPVLDRRIVIVNIDEKSLAEVGRFPWGRNVVAKLVTQLTDHYKVGAVGMDVLFAEPDKSSGFEVLEDLAYKELNDIPRLKDELIALKPSMDYDALLAAAIKGKPVVLGYEVSDKAKTGALPKPEFTLDDLNGRELVATAPTGYQANLSQLQKAARGAGIFSASVDPDGTLRSSAFLMRLGNGFYPSLSLATVAAFYKAKAIKPYYTATVDTMTEREKENGGIEKIVMFKENGLMVPIPVGYGLTTTIQFRGTGGPHGGAFPYVSAVDVLKGKVPESVLDGTIVLIGTTVAGLNDLRATPVNAEYPGVEVHANLVKSILDNRFKSRPDYAEGWEAVQTVIVGVLLCFGLPVLTPLRSIVLALCAAGGVTWFNYHAYSVRDWSLNMAVMLLLTLVLFIFNMAYGYLFESRKGRALVSRFGEYVAPELVAEMAEDPDKYTMDGEDRVLSVLFVDVRGFTTISEMLAPKALREYINLYLTAMSEDIRDKYQGTLDKYIGDAVMAFWGAPVAFPDHARRAVATALAMQHSAVRLNADFVARGWPPLKIGIGINTGLMRVGDMGSKIRRAYTVMGDAVNVASRLEGLTKVYGVGLAVGEGTRAAAPEFAYRELDLVRVKGKHEPVAIFEPLGLPSELDAATLAELERWHAALAMVRAQQWDAAEAAIVALQQEQPECGLYRLFAANIARHRAHPPGPEWDGVTNYDSK